MRRAARAACSYDADAADGGLMSIVMGLLGELSRIGRLASGGYDRRAWTGADLDCRHWFVQCADALDLEVETDCNGNLWAWWGADTGTSALVVGSHLDSVLAGGAFDGPLGIASAFAAIAQLRRDGYEPSRPVAVAVFADSEGARFGVEQIGSRLMTGALPAEVALALRDEGGTAMADAVTGAGLDPGRMGRDPARLARIGEVIELHIEQGRLPTRDGAHEGLAAAGAAIGVAERIWPHGQWRVDIDGRQDHGGTSAMQGRKDPVTGLANVVLAVRRAAVAHGAMATVGDLRIEPGSPSTIAATARLWIDARAGDEARIRRLLRDVRRMSGFDPVQEAWTAGTTFDPALTAGLAAALGDVPVLPAGAGHDAGVFASAGIPAAMILVRNRSGVTHSPAEHADEADCEAGVDALTTAIRVRSRAASVRVRG